MENITGQAFVESSKIHLDSNLISDCFQHFYHQDITDVGSVGSTVNNQMSFFQVNNIWGC